LVSRVKYYTLPTPREPPGSPPRGPLAPFTTPASLVCCRLCKRGINGPLSGSPPARNGPLGGQERPTGSPPPPRGALKPVGGGGQRASGECPSCPTTGPFNHYLRPPRGPSVPGKKGAWDVPSMLLMCSAQDPFGGRTPPEGGGTVYAPFGCPLGRLVAPRPGVRSRARKTTL